MKFFGIYGILAWIKRGNAMNYKMIVSDLDGTLLYDVFTVSKENLAAIERYKDMGGLTVPASGRCFYEIIPELRNCKDIRYCISSNGAVITDLATGERDTVCISKELLDSLLDIISDYETYFSMHCDGDGFIDSNNDNEERAQYYNVNRHYYVHYKRWSKKVPNLAQACRGKDGVEMASIFFRYQSELDECVKRLEALGGLVITSSADFNIEIIAEGASKGDGVRRLSKRLGIEKDEIIAVGDSPNDLTLLGAAGKPLAVSNAVDLLKERAEQVICSNREHIVEYILKNFIR